MEPMQDSSPGTQSVRRRQQKAMRRAARPHPYAKEQKMTDASSLPLSNAPEGESRGQMLQRHKREYREVKKQADALREQKKRLGKKDQNAKAKKKAMGKEAKTMLQDLAERHARELAELDSKKTTVIQTDLVLSLPTVPVSDTAMLAAASNAAFPRKEHASLLAAVRQAQANSQMSDTTSPSSSPSGWSLPFGAPMVSAAKLQFKS